MFAFALGIAAASFFVEQSGAKKIQRKARLAGKRPKKYNVHK